MHNDRYEEIEVYDFRRINVSDCLRGFLIELSKQETHWKGIGTEGDAFRIKALVNAPGGAAFKSMTDLQGQSYWQNQKVDYVPSNLKKGFVFYFICNRCERRTKYLYFYSWANSPVCRNCCHLPYRQATRPERKLSRFLHRHPEMVAKIVDEYLIPAGAL